MYDVVVKDVKYHQALARYCARLSFEETTRVVMCCECGIVWEYDTDALLDMLSLS